MPNNLEKIKEVYFNVLREHAEKIYKDNKILEKKLEFILGRFEEGLGIGNYIKMMEKEKEKVKILDAGCGSGGVMLPLSMEEKFEVYGVELFFHREILKLKKETDLPFHFNIADIRNLPFEDNFFDWVLFLDTIEHIKNPSIACREIYRVLKKGGFCMITTPSRFKYLFRKDPHFSIFGLLLFPNKVQKIIAKKIFKIDDYDVEKIYFSPFSILKLFPKPRSIYFLYNEPLHRENLFEKIYKKTFRKFFFDKILVRKGEKLSKEFKL
ncbi:MAG: class I SAM-dependent methyltransferase [Thermoanaerobaculia bacterium]